MFERPAAAGRERYATYANARFGFSVEYPADLLVPESESDNGDGRVFVGKRPRDPWESATSLRVWAYGSHNVNGLSLRDSFETATQQTAPDLTATRRVTYQRSGANWYVVSGLLALRANPRRQDHIFYTKTILRNGVFKTLHLRYHRREKARLDPIVTRISRSFRG